MYLYRSTGKLRYGNSNLVLDVDPEIVRYYRSFLSKRVFTHTQMYAAHISVVRKETPDMSFWNKYEGEIIDFEYSGEIHNGTVYYWINAFSKRLEEIRIELGLLNQRLYFQPPEGYLKTFHITLGNCKVIN